MKTRLRHSIKSIDNNSDSIQATLFIVLIFLLVQISCVSTGTSSDRPVESRSRNTQSVSSSPVHNQSANVITDSAVSMAVSTTKMEELVNDAAISIDGDDVSMAIVLNSSTDNTNAKRLGENFARQLASFSEGAPPGNTYLGGIWDEYTLLITVTDRGGNIIVQGAKVTSSPHITW